MNTNSHEWDAFSSQMDKSPKGESDFSIKSTGPRVAGPSIRVHSSIGGRPLFSTESFGLQAAETPELQSSREARPRSVGRRSFLNSTDLLHCRSGRSERA